ncbi:MAG: response regulator [Lachnospiraceae bacterium]|jgi:putative two-component system response regulator|nr:response regulator [Lachnospiraceae bacterium]
MEQIGKLDGIPQILIVDDVDANRLILENIIQEMGCHPLCAASANEAAVLIAKSLPQLILLDVCMPEMDGYEFCGRLKESPVTRDIPIIFISAADSSQDKVRGLKMGAVDYITKPFGLAEVTMRVSNHLELHRMRRELEASNRHLHSVINSQARRIEEEQKNILYALAGLAEGQDGKAQGGYVAHNCRLLAQSLQFSPEFTEEVSEAFIDTIEVACGLRDIGNLCAGSFFRAGPHALGQEGRRAAGSHVRRSVELLGRMQAYAPENHFLPMAVQIAQYHHACWDGSGYPQGVGGKEIPLAARITAVADLFDALTGGQQGGIAFTREESLRLVAEGSGALFDPEIVDVFLKIEKQLHCCAGNNKFSITPTN